MLSNYGSKMVVTRKDHTCEWCGTDIPKGSDVFCEWAIDDDGPMRRYTCHDCYPIIFDYFNECTDDGYLVIGFKEWLYEFCTMDPFEDFIGRVNRVDDDRFDREFKGLLKKLRRARIGRNHPMYVRWFRDFRVIGNDGYLWDRQGVGAW